MKARDLLATLMGERRRPTISEVRALRLPELGSREKRYQVELDEREINTIYTLVGFVQGACATNHLDEFWRHYGPTATALSERLQLFDDGQECYPPYEGEQ